MTRRSFTPDWEPQLLYEEVVAEGTWWYDGSIAHTIVLRHQWFDYSANDLDQLESILNPVNLDYVDFAINADGARYVWYVDGPLGKSWSNSFSTLAEAKSHVRRYGRTEIRWKGDAASEG